MVRPISQVSKSRYLAIITILQRTEEKNLEPSGPRIRCPLCGWYARRTFGPARAAMSGIRSTRVCPACLQQWKETIFVFPLFGEGALSPANDVLDFAVAAVLVSLLGWHWEFLPSFFAELIPEST